MKTFDELTISQKKAAINYAEKELVKLLQEGVLENTNEMDLSVNAIRQLAESAAEGSLYSDNGQPIERELQS